MEHDIVFGLVPIHDDSHTELSLETVRAALELHSGLSAGVHRAISPEALVSAYRSGIVNLLWSSPTLALTAPELRDAVPVVSAVRQGVAHYHGVLFVRSDAPIRSPLELRGARAAWVAPTSAAGYIFAQVTLAGHGIDPDGLYGEERFLGSHGAVVQAVLDGDADVGATFAVFEDGDASKPMIRAGFLDVPGGREVRVVLSTPPIPADLVLAHPALSERLDGRLPAIFQQIAAAHPGAVHQVLGADAFELCEPRALAELRRQLDDARALGVLDRTVAGG